MLGAVIGCGAFMVVDATMFVSDFINAIDKSTIRFPNLSFTLDGNALFSSSCFFSSSSGSFSCSASAWYIESCLAKKSAERYC